MNEPEGKKTTIHRYLELLSADLVSASVSFHKSGRIISSLPLFAKLIRPLSRSTKRKLFSLKRYLRLKNVCQAKHTSLRFPE
jgi:hypothetical protein